jgi:glycosyltransferase involved in cell wall biosynthesis
MANLKPSITIITVSKDNKSGLLKTIESILAQGYSDWELIIVIGTSQDNSLECAEEIAARDSRMSVIQQISTGIYPAMNEGIKIANGNYLWFMNSGDVFFDRNSLESGLYWVVSRNCSLIIGGYSVLGSAEIYSVPIKKISMKNFVFTRRGSCHQSMVFNTSLVKSLDGFDPQWRISADYDLCLKVINIGQAEWVPQVLSTVESGGITDQNLKFMHIEKHEIRRRNLKKNPLISMISLIWKYAFLLKRNFK